jgi:nucleotide-binding universal stress UspA family protein
LIGYDGSIAADAAIQDLEYAGLPEDANALVEAVTHTWTAPPESYGMVGPYFKESWVEKIGAVDELAQDGGNRVQSIFPRWVVRAEGAWGSPARVLILKADSWPADLIVVGSHGRSAPGRWFFGSVSQHVVTEAACSVRVGRPVAAGQRALRILIGVDGSPEAAAAVNDVAQRVWPNGAECRVIGVLEVFRPPLTELEANVQEAFERATAHQRQWLTNACESAAAALRDRKLQASYSVLEGDPKHVLLAEAEKWKAHSIFVGARGLSRFERFTLGSVSTAVAQRAHCSVQVVRALHRS